MILYQNTKYLRYWPVMLRGWILFRIPPREGKSANPPGWVCQWYKFAIISQKPLEIKKILVCGGTCRGCPPYGIRHFNTVPLHWFVSTVQQFHHDEKVVFRKPRARIAVSLFSRLRAVVLIKDLSGSFRIEQSEQVWTGPCGGGSGFFL